MTDDLQDLMMSSDSDERAFPPPHIAARFYHSSRRKSSAASSRRNSLTSHHSGRSARSARSSHGGPYSTHVAQQLRRASIIESRKARLADRAAHAEQVRLRAAMAKAAPRVASNTESRALAAQQARERLLAQVAANCHSEVERAKKVAEDAREKKAADELRKKDEMHERLAEAEKRRVLYQQSQRRPRHSALPVVDEKKALASLRLPRNEDDAARILQRMWINRQRRKAFTDFARLGLTPECIQQSDLEEARTLLSNDAVLLQTSRVLKYCPSDDQIDRNALVRIFLSAFMILGQPVAILGSQGPQEQDLVSKAKGLLLAFERLQLFLETGRRAPSIVPMLPSFTIALSKFRDAFTAWKNHDMSVLLSTMLKQFAELDAIWQTIKTSPYKQVTDEYRDSIQENQTLLLVSLKKMLGPGEAMRRVKAEIREARKAKAKKARTAGSKPKAPLNRIEGTSSATSPVALLQNATSRQPASSRDLLSPDTFIRHTASLLPDNRTVMHELALNREYRIDAEPKPERLQSIIQSVSESVHAVLQSDLGDMWITSFAGNIRKKLLGLVNPGKSMHTMIEEALDVDMITRQVKMGSFSFPQFFTFINSVLPKICAPVRDPQVKALADDDSDDYVARLARLYYVIDLLCLDKANFTLQMNAPMLVEQAASYEERSFGEALQASTPIKALGWWTQARSVLQEDLARRPENNSQPSPRITPSKIYFQGLVALTISASPEVQDVEVPETLELDIERISQIRSVTLRIIVTASILLTAKNLLKREVRSKWKSEAQRLQDIPYDSPCSVFVSALESAHALPPLTKAQLTGTIERIIADARSGQATHPVMKVLFLKLKSHVLTRLSANSAEERARVTNAAGDVLAGVGLVEFVEQISDIIDELKRIGEVDREAHGKWYDEIAKTAEREIVR